MVNALITGGNGFIGQHLRKELVDHGYRVVDFDHKKLRTEDVDFIDGDVRDGAAVRAAVEKCDIVFHLAGLLGTSYLSELVGDAIDVNIHGAINVFEAARSFGTTVVNVGLGPEWLNAYMITKKTAARFGRMYHDMFSTKIVTLELTHVYGPGQRVEPYHKAIPTFITQALSGETLEVFGHGDREMDCVYVTDVARALRLAAENASIAGLAIRVASGETIRVVELARKIASMVGSAGDIKFRLMRRGEPAEVRPDENAGGGPDAKQSLGWQPSVSLDQGLSQSIEWYRRAVLVDPCWESGTRAR